jgi:hypothetical protein
MFSKIVQLLLFLTEREQFNLPFVRLIVKHKSKGLSSRLIDKLLSHNAPVPLSRDGWK